MTCKMKSSCLLYEEGIGMEKKKRHKHYEVELLKLMASFH